MSTTVNKAILAIIFTLSFVSYFAEELSATIQIVPLLVFALLTLWHVSRRKNTRVVIESFFRADSLLFVVSLPLLIIGASLESHFQNALSLSFVLAAFLVLARCYTSLVPQREILEAYFWSGVLSISLLLTLGFSTLMESARTLERLFVFNFHPNLLGFTLGGYCCAMLWKAFSGRWPIRVLAAVFSILALTITFFASSRGSLGGVFIGVIVSLSLMFMRRLKGQATRIVLYGCVVFVLLGSIGLLLQQAISDSEMYGVVDKVLQISDPNRGVDSGFTGRFGKWEETWAALKDGSWFFGHGFRSSDSMSQLIDNSYIVIVYEVGIIPLILIVTRFGWKLRWLVWGFFTSCSADESAFCLAGTLLLVAFLANNFVARYMFGVGNPFSMLSILIFVAPGRVGATRAWSPLAPTLSPAGLPQEGLGRMPATI